MPPPGLLTGPETAAPIRAPRWEDFIATDWPEAARTLVGAEATPLCRALVSAESDRVVAPGMLDVLRFCRDVVCGRRAGVGRVILMRPPERLEPHTRPQPDSAVADGHALLALLRSAFEPAVVA